ncbi:uncharacterized protein LOC114175174 [Vigna unguiculata]|uniref:uncharacterized protein LOC114175174 n=1 Tax=Vigna unguiculata TaxID=3917 RepID=UPI001015D28E|nr:uncharacterized protein LOC114175174 [Vigna unguiculata]
MEGDKIHCIVKKDEFDIWDGKLKEGDTYIMHNFKIVKNDGQYRVCALPFKLLFIGATFVRPQAIANVPKKVYQFRSIKEVVVGNLSPNLLIDNVKTNAQSKNVVFSLMDLRYNENLNTDKLVMILTQAKVKAAIGEWPVYVSNTWNETKLLMDDDIPEIIQFKQRLNEIYVDELTIMSQSGSQLTQSSQYSDAERFVYKCLVKSISEIPLIKKEIICVIVATTIKFSLDNDGWYYFVCNHCNKRTNETGPFKCTYYDQENNIPMFKYKLQLQVCDDAFNYANFVVWDQERRNVIGISVEELQKEMIKVGEDDPKCFLDDLDVMLADNDPDNSSLGTPSKRILQNSGVFVESSQDIESSKLSATKLLKTIKKEIE